MNDASHNPESMTPPSLGTSDDYDEELLALPGPVPSPWYAVMTAAVIISSVVILVWFWPDMRYFLRFSSEPVDLGDASALDLHQLKHNSYVELSGLPRVNRMVQYTDGTWWFKKDNVRRMFPVTGQRGLLVRWEGDLKVEYSGEVQIRPTLPSNFTGRLMQIDKLPFGTRYRSVFAFFKTRWDEDIPSDAWVLLDEEVPSDNTWVLAVYGLFVAFIGLNGRKLWRWQQAWRNR
ncbi:MAG: hypothetical protein MUC50_00595 [Myxococcota bacterium]|nr:hypothetical protein [Myxococcota bacterium]